MGSVRAPDNNGEETTLNQATDNAARRLVTVFGGTGFLGRRVVKWLLADGFSVRVATRRPAQAAKLFSGLDAVLAVKADINDEDSTAKALADSYGAVNCVSLYVETGTDTFHSVHVEAATRVARLARKAGFEQLVHISGIGSDPGAASPYIRARGEGEVAVRAAFPSAIMIRPAVMFGPDDAFLKPLSDLLRRFPVFGLFGRGQTRLQPVYVGDVAEAIGQIMGKSQSAHCYELGGPEIYTYRSLVEVIALQLGRDRLLFPVPFPLSHALAFGAEMLPSPPITRNQIELMREDNISSPEAPGFSSLKITPTPLGKILPELIVEAR